MRGVTEKRRGEKELLKSRKKGRDKIRGRGQKTRGQSGEVRRGTPERVNGQRQIWEK